MGELLFVVILFGAAGGTAYAWRNLTIRRQSLERLGVAFSEDTPEEVTPPESSRELPFVRHHYLLPWVLGAILTLGVYYLLGINIYFAATFGLLVALIGGQIESTRVAARTVRIEEQLADMIDLMIGSLNAGGGVSQALENATRESRPPLRPQLEEVIGRIRLGDSPPQVLRALEQRVPLETFRLLTAALAVHWEVGGSLAPTLSIVGKTVRDRIEINRRVRTLTTQARASIYAVMATTYFLGFVMWRNDPERMRGFLATSLGQQLVAASMALQGVGIIWSGYVSRIKY